MPNPFFTIGHSTIAIDAFLALLHQQAIGLLADIRKMPGSARNPQFNQDALAPALAASQIGYEHMAALGGLRPHAIGVSPETNALWQNQSFHNYADYALSGAFHEAIHHLLAVGRERRVALMCAESVWWRCHRRLVSDNLLAAGAEVFHIMGTGRLDRARLTPGAQVGNNGRVTYPAKP